MPLPHQHVAVSPDEQTPPVHEVLPAPVARDRDEVGVSGVAALKAAVGDDLCVVGHDQTVSVGFPSGEWP